MNLKMFLLPLVATGIAVQAYATGYNNLVVTLDDSSVVNVTLSDNLQTTFSTTEMVFNDGDKTVTVERAKVKTLSFNFSKTSGITLVNDGLGTLENLPEGSVISVYTVDGRLVKSVVASGNAVLPALPAGTYVISVNGNSLKVCVK
jgi:hypothetical protein